MFLLISFTLLLHSNQGIVEGSQGIENDIYSIASEFATKENIKSLVVYSKNGSWTPTMRNVYRQSAFNRYVGFDKNNGTRLHSWPSAGTGKILHVYDDDDIDRLNVLLTKHNSFEALAPICKRNSSCESVWLIHVPNVSEPDLKDLFIRTPLRLDSQTYAITQDDFAYDAYDIYKIDEKSDVVEVRKYFQWKNSTGLHTAEENIWKRRSDLKGYHIRVVSGISPPFTTYVESGCNSSECFKGIYADTFLRLSKIMNFTFTIEHVKVYGGLKDGKWTGMVGLLKDRKKDLGVSPFTLKQSRASVVDYLPTLMVAYEQFFIRNPAESYDWVAYTLPLTRDAWLAIVVFSFLIPLIMALTMTNLNNTRDYEEYSLSNCYGLLFKSLMMMGCSVTPCELRKRIAFISIFVGSMLLYYQWEAMLISYFQTPTISIPFNSLEEFLSKSDKKLYVVGGTVYEYNFRNADDPIKKRIWKERMAPYIEAPDYPVTNGELLPTLMKDGDLAAYGNAVVLKSYDVYKKCEVIALPKKYGLSQEAFVISKNSSLTPAFTYYLKQFIENGLVSRIKQMHKTEDQVCPSYQGKPLGLQKCITLFGIISFGAVSSLLWFLMELILPKFWINKILSVWGNINQKNKREYDSSHKSAE